MQISAMSKLNRVAKAKKISLGCAAAGVAVVAGGVAMAPAASAAPAAQSGSVSTWINESLAVMRAHGIPGTYNGIYKNLMRESSGNPNAINGWDSNAAKGIPSKGLMQVIDPTFKTYHVPGTSWNIYDPVANITAACNYAAHVYGTIDNVNSAY
ncbi:transglycosylase SLT domain-containing protein [Actinacidiphila sp. bgisy167]|uniref:transglycosylase SLT domain-containing protein n=1 Tax=Actinacidiphila sp. bgisy167 TaxID=3413797 RepID=UPI003D718457